MQTPVRRSMQTLCRLSALLSKGTTRGLCDVSVSACSTGNVARSTRSRHPQALRNPETSLGMQALAKLHPEPGLWKCEVDRPSISREEVLIRVKSSSLCGTDLHIYHWDQWSRSAVRPPVILGHEFFGTVEEVGDGVVGIEKGQRVTAEGHITCGHCRNCRAAETRHLCRYSDGIGISRNGGFAEFVSVPSQNVIKLPNEIRDDMAACMDPLGNAVHSALSFDLIGEDVLITGSGPIGVMSAAVCKMVGARRVVVTDISDYRLNLAHEVGADATINVSRDQSMRKVMGKLGMVEGFDVGLEMSGQPSALTTLLENTRNGGKIACLGLPTKAFPVEMDKVILRGLSIKGVYGREMFETWYKMTNLLVAGLQDRLEPVITHRLPADDYLKALKIMEDGASGKIILSWA